MKIAYRLGIGFTVLICLFGAYSLFAVDRIGALTRLAEKLHNQPHAVSELALRTESGIRTVHQSLQQLTAEHNDKHIAVVADQIEARAEEILVGIDSITERNDREPDVLREIRKDLAVWEHGVAEILMLKRGGRHRDAVERLNRTHPQPAQELEANLRRLSDQAHVEASELIAYARKTDEASTGATLSLLFLIVVLACGITVWLAIGMREQLDAALVSAEAARGSMNEMFEQQKELERDAASMAIQVGQVVSRAVDATAHISTAAEDMARSTHERAIHVDEARNAVGRIPRMLAESAREADAAASAAASVREQAQGSGDALRQAVQKISQAAELVSESAATLEFLGASSREIGEIARVIGAVSDRTSLLALNASIDAARAGDQGRGFGLVADEIRNLAEQADRASRHITRVVESVQSEIGESVEGLKRSSNDYAEGIELADQAGETMGQIVQRTEDIGHRVGRIAADLDEQSATTGRISHMIESLSSATPIYAANVTAIERASGEISDLMAKLRHRTAPFTLSDEGDNAPHYERNGNLDLMPGGDGSVRPGRPMLDPSSERDVVNEATDREK